MAIKRQIDCIRKRHGDSPWDRITHVGGVHPDGTRWKLTQERAVHLLEDGWGFYVVMSGQAAWCEVAISQQGYKYIRMAADGDLPNNLLNLPECS